MKRPGSALRWCECVGVVMLVSGGVVAAPPTTPAPEGAVAAPAVPQRPEETPRAAEPESHGEENHESEAATASSRNGTGGSDHPAPADQPANQPAGASADPRETIAKLVAGQPDWACEYEAHAITDRHVIVACRGGLVLTLARTATGVQLIGRRQVNGRVTGFYEQGGAIWARVVAETAESIIAGTLKATGAAAEPAVTPTVRNGDREEAATGRRDTLVAGNVSRVDGRDVVVDFPEEHGVAEGERLALTPPQTDDYAPLTVDPVIARVTRVMGNRVVLRLGMNETVAEGYAAERTTERETASRRNPPRVYDVWEVRSALRPLLNLGTVGGGVSGEFGVARRLEHFTFGLDVSPFAVAGATERKTLVSGGGYVFGAVDHAIYSAGVGVGASTVNDTNSESDAGSGLTIVQLLRIGAVDGLHLQSRVEAVIFRSEVLFGYLQLQGQLGVADGTWLVVRGGGGSIGYGFGEVVMRNLLWGTGKAGSTFLELGLGGAGLFQQSCPELPPVVRADDIPQCTDLDIGGPMFTAGMEWRL